MPLKKPGFQGPFLFDKEVSHFSDAELVASVLAVSGNRSDSLALASQALRHFGNTRELLSASGRELIEWGGRGKGWEFFNLIVEISNRLQRIPLLPKQFLRSSRQVFDHFKPGLEVDKKEKFWVVLLDTKNALVRVLKVSEGTLDSSSVHPREVFRAAVLESAARVILVHNHPSGDPSPSLEDFGITTRLIESGRVLGIDVVDHVIIGASDHFSFADEGLI